jgi:transmembrane sensor
MNTGDNSNIDYNDLAIRFLNGNASTSEIGLLQSWTDQSAENKAIFIQLKISWMASAQAEKNRAIDTPAALSELNYKIGFREEKASNTAFPIIKIAAIFLLTFLLGALGTYFVIKNKITGILHQSQVYIYSPKGSKAMTILPDGTKVWLNAGSSLVYNTGDYGKNDRQVTLIGEGFFKVVSNARKPFIVNAKGVKVKALGMEFNVKAYPEEEKVEATLVTGIIKVDGKNQNKQTYSVTLKPHQQVTLFAGKATINAAILTDPDKVDAEKLNEIKLEGLSSALSVQPSVANVEKTDLYTSWKDDKWIFEGEEIGKLATLLERRYNIHIVFKSEELRKYRFTGTFQNETVEQILKVLKLTTPLQYEIDKGKITLTLNPSLKMKYKKYMSD